MTDSLDIHLLPTARYAGRDYPELLRLYAGEPPRRRARGREGDRLVLYLAMTGSAPIAPGKQDQALEDLAHLYYSTPGSVTAAMRRVAEELNKELLDRNLRLSASSRLGLGVLVQMVIRGSQLTLGVSGPAQAYLLTAAGVQHYLDPDQAEGGLGLSRVTPLSFFQGSLQSGDTLLLTAQPAPEWNAAAFAGLHGQGPESLRRRLFVPAVADVNAVLVQARTGKGMFNLPKPGQPVPAAGEARRAPAASAAVSRPAAQSPASKEITSAAPEIVVAAAASPVLEPAAELVSAPISPPETAGGAVVVSTTPEGVSPSATGTGWTMAEAPAADNSPVQAAPPSPSPRAPIIRPALAQVSSGIGWVFRRAGAAVRSILVRILPEEALSGIPSSVMAFTALAAPAVIVTVASMAYMRLGRDAQFETLFNQARQIGQRAATQADVAAKHDDLEAALGLLRQAEAYNSNAETAALRSELRRLMDEMELVFRVDYRPAIIGGLPAEAQITRLMVNDDDLYLLDGASGNVLHARLTARGYELDPAFACGPAAGVPGLGHLIDIALWQKGFTPEAELVAIDGSGTFLFCSSDTPPEKIIPTQPENVEVWGKPVGIAVEQSSVYVLDLAGNGVWSYTFTPEDENPDPIFFFNEEIPDVQDMVDFTVNRTDLYMLQKDGKLTLCTYSGFTGIPTRCTNPGYRDFRPGRENLPLIPPSPFVQIQNTAPPDPSLFLLEAQTQAIYHFSLRNLAFQRQYMPDADLISAPATAFSVENIRRYLYLAVGNQVFYAVMP